MQTKLGPTELNELDVRIKELPSKDDFSEFRLAQQVILQAHQDSLKTFQSKLEDSLLCVGRYDEILSQKAQKHSVTQIHQSLQKELDTLKQRLNSEIQMRESVKLSVQQLNEAQEDLGQQIQQAVSLKGKLGVVEQEQRSLLASIQEHMSSKTTIGLTKKVA